MQSKNLNYKLLSVDRTINIYSNKKNKMIEEIDINIIPFSSLKQIVNPKEDDPQLYDGYLLNAKQMREINKYLTKKIIVNFKLYYYVLESSGIYDWGTK